MEADRNRWIQRRTEFLVLKGATFTRSGYTQTGWATSDGGVKAYDLGAYYTANAAITLYPFWTHAKVQLWEGGPYWATTNIGAENPEDYGYHFWWGGIVGYKRENDAWVARNGSSSNFSFIRVIRRPTTKTLPLFRAKDGSSRRTARTSLPPRMTRRTCNGVVTGACRRSRS